MKSEKEKREVKVKRVIGFKTEHEFIDARGKPINTTKGDWA